MSTSSELVYRNFADNTGEVIELESKHWSDIECEPKQGDAERGECCHAGKATERGRRCLAVEHEAHDGAKGDSCLAKPRGLEWHLGMFAWIDS
jgi:hypothetical protein